MTRPIKNLSGAVATGDATHVGTNDIDQFNNLLTGQDQSATDPVTLATTTIFNNAKLRIKSPTTGKNFIINSTDIAADRNLSLPLVTGDDTLTANAATQTLTNKTLTSPSLTNASLTTPTLNSGFLLRNPANTQSLTVINPAIASAQNYQFNEPFDYYVFIDTDDGNKIKAKSGRTGGIEFTHATDAGNVINSCCTTLGTAGGLIRLGTGVFNVNSTINIRSHQSIIGSGSRATILQLQAGNNGAILFFLYSPSFTTLQWTNDTHGDIQCTVAALSLDGNKANNTGTTHGLVKYGYDWRIYDIAIHDFTGNGIISQWSSSANVPPDPNDMFVDRIHDITIHDCSTGIWWMGPNNSMLRGIIIWSCGEGAILCQTIPNVLDGGFQLSDSHVFFNNRNHLAGNTTYAEVYCQSSYLTLSEVIIETDAGIGLYAAPAGQTITYTPAGGSATNFTTFGANVWGTGLQGYNFNSTAAGGGAVVLASTNNFVTGTWYNINLFAAGGTAVTILADGNTVEGTFWNNVGSGTTALRLGKSGTPVHGCTVRANFYNNTNAINWGDAGNTGNSVIANIYQLTGQTDLLGAVPDDLNNIVLLQVTGGTSTYGNIWTPLNGHNAVFVSNKTMGNSNVYSGLSVSDATNVVLGTTTGTKIGTATTQKLGFYNAAPIAQQANTAGAISASGSYTANEQKMLNDAYSVLRNLGLLS